MRTHADASHHTEAGSRRTRTSGVRRLKVGLAAVAVFMATFAGLTAAGVTPAGASTLDGTATIANPGNDKALTSGGSDTYFTLNLPAQAHCDGDSATEGYFVFSYLVKEGTNPAGVSFRTGVPGDGYGLFTPPHSYWGAVDTAAATKTDPGQIIGIPNNLEFGPLVSALKLPIKTLLYASGNKTGVWEAGVACEKNGGVTDYWNTEVTFTANSSDPNGFVWSAKAGACKADATEGFYSAAAATFTGGTYDAFTVASSGCPTPSYTEKGTLPTGVILTKAGLLSGVPTEGGTFKLTFTAEIGTGAKKTQAFTLTIPLYIVTQTLPAAKPGTKYSETLKASGGTAPYKWTETTALPTALKLTLSSAGVLSGTVPTGTKANSYTVVIKATDSTKGTAKTASKSYTFTVS
jgi:hypothetical protein